MEDIRSDKTAKIKFWKRNPILKSVLKYTIALVVLIAMSITLNYTILPLFGYRFNISAGRPGFMKVIRYSEEESSVLSVLINDALLKSEIPQFQYLREKTGFDDQNLRGILGSLDLKGDIAINDSGIIIDVYPWTSRWTGIQVYLSGGDYQAIHQLTAASAIYAMSAFSLYNMNGRIDVFLNNAKTNLIVEIENNEIVFTSNLAAVIYRTEDFRESRFFASPDGAREYYGENFELNRLIRLDRALKIGDIIAENIKDKID